MNKSERDRVRKWIDGRGVKREGKMEGRGRRLEGGWTANGLSRHDILCGKRACFNLLAAHPDGPWGVVSAPMDTTACQRV